MTQSNPVMMIVSTSQNSSWVMGGPQKHAGCTL
jgi:hypothetical protein